MKKIIGISLVFMGLGLFSCNNDKVDIPDQNEELLEKSASITIAEVQVEAATAETIYEVEFFANAEEKLTRWWRIGKRFEMNGKLRYRKNCPNVEITEGEDEGYPRTISMNYGEGTELKNGKVLSGLIEIVISAPRNTQEYTKSVKYTNFGIDSLLINGNSMVEVDKVDTMFREYNSDLTFLLADGTTINRSSARTWHWISGADTKEDQTDDIITISGSAIASMDDVANYKKEITTPLMRKGECKHIVEGTVVVTLDGKVISTLDYGDGTCDAIATLTDIVGEVTTIDLSKKQLNRKKKQNQNGNNQGGKGNGNGNGNG